MNAAQLTESSGDPSTDAIASLLEERRRYEGWLTALEQRRASTPPHVYTRVREDYETRHAQVMDQLRGRSAELQHTVDQVAERVEMLESQEAERRDERAEAELRAAVGEYAPDQWDALRQEAEQELARLEQERGAAAAELAQLQEMLRLASSERSAPEPAPEAPPVPEPAEESAQAAEIDFVKSMIDPSPRRPAPTPVAVPSRPTPAAQPTASAASPAAAGKTDAVPVFLRDVPVEQVKSLKCSECGTMNYPTEWYCERCGGELAAM